MCSILFPLNIRLLYERSSLVSTRPYCLRSVKCVSHKLKLKSLGTILRVIIRLTKRVTMLQSTPSNYTFKQLHCDYYLQNLVLMNNSSLPPLFKFIGPPSLTKVLEIECCTSWSKLETKSSPYNLCTPSGFPFPTGNNKLLLKVRSSPINI